MPSNFDREQAERWADTLRERAQSAFGADALIPSPWLSYAAKHLEAALALHDEHEQLKAELAEDRKLRSKLRAFFSLFVYDPVLRAFLVSEVALHAHDLMHEMRKWLGKPVDRDAEDSRDHPPPSPDLDPEDA
jgi:hypothetical protein